MDLSKLIMEYKGYYAIVKIDAEDQIFVGEVFGIADSLSFHGTSVEELEEMFHQSVDSYFDACRHFGKEPERWELI
ncbi:type II toxin-antitoxin system HicB family antitoxin [Congzhengia minquanensis]|uniref:Type II toxin-antitoxin system HicB family antitoxin n=1 Tax=Congzhengia minquanensis TaxID=2763657 RepID=A0A926DPB6_9FIRM|nr:type II toxin-antitoxin system HicB family antitoxin [Congzhengia minquanensis]MBC8540825.1 type II toxin-antitoxin system HicB family antitoxin [Congzhengia minquanensis]